MWEVTLTGPGIPGGSETKTVNATADLNNPIYQLFNPNGDNSVVCTNFTVQPGELKTFAIDNAPPPGGLARTIGYWKN